MTSTAFFPTCSLCSGLISAFWKYWISCLYGDIVNLCWIHTNLLEYSTVVKWCFTTENSFWFSFKTQAVFSKIVKGRKVFTMVSRTTSVWKKDHNNCMFICPNCVIRRRGSELYLESLCQNRYSSHCKSHSRCGSYKFIKTCTGSLNHSQVSTYMYYHWSKAWLSWNLHVMIIMLSCGFIY